MAEDCKPDSRNHMLDTKSFGDFIMLWVRLNKRHKSPIGFNSTARNAFGVISTSQFCNSKALIFWNNQANRIDHPLVREVELPVQIEMAPSGNRAVANGFGQFRLALLVFLCGEFPRQIEIVPANNCVLDKPPTPIGNFLILLFALGEFLVMAERNGPGKFVRAFDLVELFLHRLP